MVPHRDRLVERAVVGVDPPQAWRAGAHHLLARCPRCTTKR